MIAPQAFFEALRRRGFTFFTGVPDSLLKDFCAYVTDHTQPSEHIIAANEGGAVALAAGHYLATGHPGVVYMQNSGQGNSINPLTSLADPEVFGIPMLLVIGWRGAPGLADEPQHAKQGQITLDLLQTLGIRHAVLPSQTDAAMQCLDGLVEAMIAQSAPVALIVRDDTFERYALRGGVETQYSLTREAALRLVLNAIGHDAVVVATTGKTSRELFELREAARQEHRGDFLTVGSMGHASQIALAIALARPRRQVFCLDGDGAAIMHMGALAIIGTQAPKNFRHIVFNNGAHDSVGGQPTAGFAIDLSGIALASGYRAARCVESVVDIEQAMADFSTPDGPTFLEIRVNKGARGDLGRPTMTPAANKAAFMKFLAV